MAIETAAPRSRRALLAAGLGGALATVAAALGRPSSANAADLDPLVIGFTNVGTLNTTLATTTSNGVGFGVSIANNSSTADALQGIATDGVGIRAQNSSSQPAISGRNIGHINPGPALLAVAGTTTANPTPKVGVVIHAEQTDTVTGRGAIYGFVGGVNNTAIEGQGGGFGVRGSGTTSGVFGFSSAGNGVQGQSETGFGLRGVSISNTGLRGDSTTGTAVRAFSVSGRAVNATAGGSNAPAIASQSTSGWAAVQGYSGGNVGMPAARPATGVQGRCDEGANAIGVFGESASGIAVLGDSNNGYGTVGFGYYGVYGSGTAGVVGDVDGGTGVQGWTGVAFAPDPATTVGVWAGAEDGRTALQVQGVAKFNRSGRASFAAGQSSKKVIVPGGITAAAFGLATLQTNRAGIWVRAVVPATADSSITIYLNAAVTATTVVGWQVIS